MKTTRRYSMAEKNPIDDLFDEISGILRFLEKNLNKTPSAEDLPEDIIPKLMAMERRVDLLNRISDDIVAAAGLSKEEMRTRLMGLSRDMPEDARETVAKGEAVKTAAEAFRQKVEEREKQLSAGQEEEAGQPAHGVYADRVPREKEASASETDELDTLLNEPGKKEKKPVEGRKRKNKFKRFGGDDKWKPL